MSAYSLWRISASGRLLEITNGYFVEAKHENPIPERRGALEKLNGRVWVGSSSSSNSEAVINRHQRLSDW